MIQIRNSVDIGRSGLMSRNRFRTLLPLNSVLSLIPAPFVRNYPSGRAQQDQGRALNQERLNILQTVPLRYLSRNGDV